MSRLLLICLLPLMALAQGPDTLWTRLYGGYPNDEASAVCAMADGGFMLAGSINTLYPQWWDVRLNRIDSAGTLLWARSYGQAALGEEARAVVANADGGVTVAGSLAPVLGDAELYLLRVDAAGDTLWTRRLSGPAAGYALAMIGTATGYAVAGWHDALSASSQDAMLVLISSNGDLPAIHHYGAVDADEYAFSVRRTADGGCLLAGGSTPGEFQGYYFVVRTDGAGNSQWERTYAWGAACSAIDAVEADDGTLRVAGTVRTAGNDYYFGVLKLSADGDSLASWLYGDGAFGYVTAMTPRPDGGLLLAGYRASPDDGRSDAVLMRTDAAGNLLWSTSYPQSGDNRADAVCPTADGGYLLAGRHSTDTLSYASVIRTAPDPALAARPPRLLSPSSFRLAVYPNPFNSTTEIRYALPRAAHISLTVFDVTGREVATLVDAVVSAGEQRLAWQAEGVASGVYFVRLDAAERAVTRKVLLVR